MRASSTAVLMLLGASYPFSACASAPDIEWFGYAQLTVERLDQDVEFGADRIRGGLRVNADRLTAGIQLDVNAGDLDERLPGTLPSVIKDVYAAYRFHDLATVRLGQFKTPLGMDFLIPGHGLDVTKRGMERGLVLERTLGIMLSGHAAEGRLAYDAGLFNPAGRSAATAHVGDGPDDQVGQDNAWAMRVAYEVAPNWHAEAAVGASEAAGGPGTADYEVYDVGFRYTAAPWTVKGEYIDGRNVLGVNGRDESVWYLHVDYAIAPRTRLVLRHYAGRSSGVAAASTELSNTYAGVTHFVYRANGVMARLQANYVIAAGDRDTYTGVSGFRDDVILVQLQVGYLP